MIKNPGLFKYLIVVFCLLLLWGCTGAPGGSSTTTDGSGTRVYAGSEPKGDYIVIEIDTTGSKVRRINFTTGETNGWFDYINLPFNDPQANGFSILKKAAIMSNAGTNQYVIFAEYPSAACVYQMFMVTNSVTYTEGNPVYVVYRQAIVKNDFYAKAYNWMKFSIDDISSNSDMECGFAAYDDSAHTGLMYGAGYSRKRGTGNDLSNCGFQNINDGGANVDAFSDNPDAGALTMWTGSTGDWLRAISLTGTPSGTVILDFGVSNGGGSGIAIPQTTAVDNPAAWWSTVDGTYFTMLYEYDKQYNEARINPLKIVISGGNVKVYDYTNHTSGTAFFNETLTMLSNATTNQSPVTNMTVMQILNYFSSNQNASSPIVTNAHLCEGAFLFTGTNQVLFTIFDPSGRFLGFTMFDDSSGQYKIRFGFGIKDSGYSDSF